MENIIGKRLTQLREERGWTKTYTAEKLGIKTMSTYANWEYGIRTPDSEMLTKIADLFDVSTDFLLGRTNVRNQNTADKELEELMKDPKFMAAYHDYPGTPGEARKDLIRFLKFIKERDDDKQGKRED
ncbi:helix-turn-helix domain-containing protein [Sporolactobacillus shoreicorticis]|uniref:Helix-turn-helix domain-containing protein n=1 Tax=Sporolactobacillus shoreicorticis TaxID=1923877 RepID=A0ABW5S985_9BACL|nr:helix-turn-helix transcriptional regulator [Sporolactobacillus shoreicorticis]MCO7126026.1 helix-turn-helix domain-containing protein [Sporolactobacillus shoreicorticis]